MAHNPLHQVEDEDWQHVKAGTEAALPIDFLVTLPTASRSVISMKPGERGLEILGDGKPISPDSPRRRPRAVLTPRHPPRSKRSRG